MVGAWGGAVRGGCPGGCPQGERPVMDGVCRFERGGTVRAWRGGWKTESAKVRTGGWRTQWGEEEEGASRDQLRETATVVRRVGHHRDNPIIGHRQQPEKPVEGRELGRRVDGSLRGARGIRCRRTCGRSMISRKSGSCVRMGGSCRTRGSVQERGWGSWGWRRGDGWIRDCQPFCQPFRVLPAVFRPVGTRTDHSLRQ